MTIKINVRKFWYQNPSSGKIYEVALKEGTPVAATGTITFADNPTAEDTITLNGVTWTFKTSGATGNQTNIGVDLEATLTQLVSDLNGSADTDIDDATYSADATTLTITHDTAGSFGNTFGLAASADTPSGANLTGGVAQVNGVGRLTGTNALVSIPMYNQTEIAFVVQAADITKVFGPSARIDSYLSQVETYHATNDATTGAALSTLLV